MTNVLLAGKPLFPIALLMALAAITLPAHARTLSTGAAQAITTPPVAAASPVPADSHSAAPVQPTSASSAPVPAADPPAASNQAAGAIEPAPASGATSTGTQGTTPPSQAADAPPEPRPAADTAPPGSRNDASPASAQKDAAPPVDGASPVAPPDSANASAGTTEADRLLPQDLTITAMFLHADAVVRTVMLGLIAASILTWTILLAKGIDVARAKDRLRRSVPVADADETLNELHLRLANRKEPLTAMVAAAFDEIRRSGDAPRAGIKERVASHLRRIEIAFGRRLTRSTGLLATIGSTAPFIGLFGTVWGIMDSFIGISQAQTTNLAVVAPGIAEALLATAAGLVAAIPAVVIYNGFARSIGGYRAMLADLAAAVERLVSRELDSGRRSSKAAAE